MRPPYTYAALIRAAIMEAPYQQVCVSMYGIVCVIVCGRMCVCVCVSVRTRLSYYLLIMLKKGERYVRERNRV